MIGDSLNQYQITASIGAGGMGEGVAGLNGLASRFANVQRFPNA
jgi:hypothetical protein